MASLHKDPRGRSPYFYAAFSLSKGKRVYRSTKQTDRKKAWKVALKWEEAKELADRGELTEAASRKVLDEIRAIVGDSKLPTITVRGVFRELVGWKEALPKSQHRATVRKTGYSISGEPRSQDREIAGSPHAAGYSKFQGRSDQDRHFGCNG